MAGGLPPLDRAEYLWGARDDAAPISPLRTGWRLRLGWSKAWAWLISIT